MKPYMHLIQIYLVGSSKCETFKRSRMIADYIQSRLFDDSVTFLDIKLKNGGTCFINKRNITMVDIIKEEE